MGNKYSKLNIDRKLIGDWIKLWCEMSLNGEFQISCNDISQRIQYTIINNNKEIKIDFIKCNGGLTSISPKVGRDIETSTKIAEYIYNKAKSMTQNVPFANGFSIIISKEEFDTIIEILKGIDAKVINYSEYLTPGEAQYYLYRLKGPLGDNITLKYFINTSRMQLQGKPLHLYNEIVSIVSDMSEFDDVVDAQLRYCAVDVSNKDIDEEMKYVFGDLYDFLSTTQKSIIAGSFIFSKIVIEMPDYTGLIQPALRGLEGYIKKLLTNEGVECNSEDQLGKFFSRKSKSEPFIMNEDTSLLINNEKKEQTITYLYNYYFKTRHPYNHATSRDFDTVIIESREKADDIFREIISVMVTSFSRYNNNE